MTNNSNFATKKKFSVTTFFFAGYFPAVNGGGGAPGGVITITIIYWVQVGGVLITIYSNILAPVLDPLTFFFFSI